MRKYQLQLSQETVNQLSTILAIRGRLLHSVGAVSPAMEVWAHLEDREISAGLAGLIVRLYQWVNTVGGNSVGVIKVGHLDRL